MEIKKFDTLEFFQIMTVLYMYTSEKTDSHLASNKHDRSPNIGQSPGKAHELYQLS